MILTENTGIHMGESAMRVPMKIESFERKHHSVRKPCTFREGYAFSEKTNQSIGKLTILFNKWKMLRRSVSKILTFVQKPLTRLETTFRRVVVRGIGGQWGPVRITETYWDIIWFDESYAENQGKWVAFPLGPRVVHNGRIQICLECVCTSWYFRELSLISTIRY